MDKLRKDSYEISIKREAALAAAVLDTGALSELLWTVSDDNFSRSGSVFLRQAEHSSEKAIAAMEKIQALWKHDYHDCLNLDSAAKILLRFDDYEYGINFASADIAKAFIKERNLQIDTSHMTLMIKKAEDKLEALKRDYEKLSDWLA
ncbi:MAG: hypothetical protein HC888_04810 [Candidatus Competibacteraceae bacterium]|nr:hypothetical protein [Candidatus Competibacteraceae bacterium]